MKRIRALLAVLVIMCSAPVFADDFDWSQCWCNYGAGIEAGDMLLAVDGGLPWTIFDAYNSGGWSIPYVMADFEVVCPIWKLPFSFGGYAGFGMSKYYVTKEQAFHHSTVLAGASASYHLRMPPEQLDLYASLKSGVIIDFSDSYSSGRNVAFDFGYTVGASWYFTEAFGVNLEIGYPMNRVGVVFQF